MEYMVDPRERDWTVFTPEGERLDLLYDRHIRPTATLNRMVPGRCVRRHSRPVDAFQVVLEGTARYPQAEARALSVHYAEARRSYGPFMAGPEGVLFLEVTARPDDPSDVPDLAARELFFHADDAAWRPHASGGRCKTLWDDRPGRAGIELIEGAAWAILELERVPQDVFYVVTRGSGTLSGGALGLHGVYYAKGEPAHRRFRCGKDGATLLVLRFGR